LAKRIRVKKKKHHYVPEAYLKGFSDDSGFLYVARKDDPETNHRAKPSETGFRKYYYSQPLPSGGMNHNALEDAFSTFETKWHGIVQVLSSGQRLNSVLSDLLAMIGFQRVRVPAFRDAIELSLQRFVLNELEELKRRNMLPLVPPEYPNIADEMNVLIDPHRSIHGMTELLRAHGPILETMGYQVLQNETKVDFITTDNPVSFFTKNGGEILPYLIRPSSQPELFFPVTSRQAILGTGLDRKRYLRSGLKRSIIRDPKRIQMLNRCTAQFGYEAIFSSTILPPNFVKRYQNSPVLSPDSPAFDPDNFQMPQFVFGSRQKLSKWRD
jgi:hypothetical protein